MFHPVGAQPPSVYWRRRLLVAGSIVLVVVLLVLTVKAASGGGGSAAGGAPHTTPARSPSVPSTTHSTTSAPKTSSSHAAATKSGATPSAAPCAPGNLSVEAVAGQKSYTVGDQPVVELQVTNTGGSPCVQDLADKEVELRVYNGESRVWGSHDCQIQPGTNAKTLASRTPVRVAVTWSGLTSQPGCQGTRQRVGAGTYTLYAVLAGKTGKATQFTIS